MDLGNSCLESADVVHVYDMDLTLFKDDSAMSHEVIANLATLLNKGW